MMEAIDRQFAIVVFGVVILVTAITVFAFPVAEERRAVTAGGPLNKKADLQTFHAREITGKNVSVGVMDVTGFDTRQAPLADQVVAARAFAPGETITNHGNNNHGTAVASVLSRVAPDAELYLASFDTVDGYGNAMAWLLEQDVDVIVITSSFYGQPGDGSSRVARIADLTAQQDVVVVASAGNLGRGHWTGRYDSVRDGYLLFGDTRRNYLRGDETELSLWLSWEPTDAAPAANYTLKLYADEGNESRLVARSQPYPGDGEPNERIEARLDPQTKYYVTVAGPGTPTGDTIDIASPTHRLEHSRRARSVVAPATADSVISVGAYDSRRGRVEPFSSAGPVDGRPGVDVVAPDRQPVVSQPSRFTGSSAAAPYIGGIAALMLDVDSNVESDRIERVLEQTARDVWQPGLDHVSGHGRVIPGAAISVVANGTSGG